jgi:hypothetical protein
MKAFFSGLVDQQFVPTALRVSMIVGSLLLCINHGTAILRGQMTRDRWISAGLTYIVPYIVNIHGQSVSRDRQRSIQEES